MKLLKILITFIALVSLQIAAAQWLHVPPPVEAKNLMVFTAGVPVAGGGDSCTGGLLLSAHFENSDTVTVGTPAGCAAGTDQTWALSGSSYTTSNVADGTYALLHDANTDVTDITVSSRDNADERSGRVSFTLYTDASFDTGSDILTIKYDATNKIWLFISGTELKARYYASGGMTGEVVTSGAGLAAGNSYAVVLGWRQGTTTPTMYLNCNAATPGSTNDNLGTMSASPTLIRIGDDGGWSFRGKIDAFKIYNTYQ